MPDLLSNAAAWLDGQLKANASQAVTFCRGSLRIPWSASIGATHFVNETKHGQQIEWESRDFIGTAADLTDGVDLLIPAVGDWIEQTIGTVLCSFALVSPTDEKPYRYCDPGRQSIRVHTKQILKQPV